MKIRVPLIQTAVAATLAFAALRCAAQTMPATDGETLSGKHIVPADAVRGHIVILVAGFSHAAGMQCGAWMKAVHDDIALKDISAFEFAMLEKAPGMLRGAIKNGMRKGMSPAEQDQFVVMTQDQKLWEKFFDVENDKDPYVVMLDANGNVLWHGHGAAANLEPLLKRALKQ